MSYASSNRLIECFRREVDRTERQTREDQRALALARARKPHGEELRPLLPQEVALVRDNLRLVFKVASWYRDDYIIPFADLLQEGAIGLMYAAENWEPELGTFSTYAVIRIRTRCGVAKKAAAFDQGIRVSDNAIVVHRRLARFEAKLAQQLGRQPTEDELFEKSELGERRFQQLRQLPKGVSVEHASRFRSATKFDDGLAEESSDHNNNRAANTISTDWQSPEEIASHVELCEVMRKLLATLTPREEFVIRHHFGFDEEEESLKEIGVHLGVLQERVRQIECKALQKLRHHSRSRRLRSFI